jgi:hypothetical protein
MITGRMRGTRHVMHTEDRWKVDKVFIGKPEGTQPFGRYRYTHI